MLLGTIRASRTRCTTQLAIIYYLLLGSTNLGIIERDSNPPNLNLRSFRFSQHINLLFAQVEGVEPSSSVLETGMLPLHHTCIFVGHYGIEPYPLTERFYRPSITPVTEASQLHFP